MNRVMCIVAMVGALLGLSACEKQQGTSAAPASSTSASAALPGTLFLASAPAEAMGVKAAKAGAKPGDKVVLVGRVGGSKEPFVPGRAVFTVVDTAVKSCADNPEDTCTTPWDYCCESRDEITANAATVQVTGADGQPLKAGLEGVHGLKGLSVVTVVGTVAQAEGPNLLVRAEGIHIAP